MAMKHIRSGEVDTSDEIAKALNILIDNMNLVEAKLEQVVAGKPKVKKPKGTKNA